jgi:hypothetical protein
MSAAVARLRAIAGDKAAVRLDAQLTRPDTGATLLIDFAQVHPSASSYRAASLASVRRVLDWELTGQEAGLPKPEGCDQASAVRLVEKQKRSRYLPLLAYIEHQMAQAKRHVRPELRGAVVSHSLEPSRDTIAALDWLTSAFTASQDERIPRGDGIALNTRVSNFRRDLRMRLAFASASGFSRMCLAAGYPGGSGNIW